MGGVGVQELLLIFIIFPAIFLAMRFVLLWYWKVDKILENQQKQIDLLVQLVKQSAKGEKEGL